jgi:hypothetical protein
MSGNPVERGGAGWRQYELVPLDEETGPERQPTAGPSRPRKVEAGLPLRAPADPKTRGTRRRAAPAPKAGDAAARARLTRARADLVAGLRDIPFADAPDPEMDFLGQQRELEARYLDWAAEVHAARQQVFGSDYELGSSMKSHWSEGLLHGSFEGLRGMLSSMSRSPFRNALVTIFSPRPDGQQRSGELGTGADALVVGGVGGGTGSFFYEMTLQKALDKRAREGNLPQMEPVDPKLLVPDAPPVKLVIRTVNGRRVKQYYEPATVDSPAQGHEGLDAVSSRPLLQHQAEKSQWWRGFWAGFRDEKHLGSLVQPLTTGTTNATRRLLSSAPALLDAASVYGRSAAASGLAAFATKFALQAAKGAPYLGQARVDGLLGETVWLNQYTPVGRGGAGELATWSDALTLKLPKAAFDTVCESATLLGKTGWDPSLGLLGDWGIRHVLPNIATSLSAPGYAILLAQIFRGGNTDSQPGEDVHSLANLAQQFMQSAVNDLTWPLYRDLMSKMKTDPLAARKLRLAVKASGLQNEKGARQRSFATEQARLPALLNAAGRVARLPPQLERVRLMRQLSDRAREPRPLTAPELEPVRDLLRPRLTRAKPARLRHAAPARTPHSAEEALLQTLDHMLGLLDEINEFDQKLGPARV